MRISGPGDCPGHLLFPSVCVCIVAQFIVVWRVLILHVDSRRMYIHGGSFISFHIYIYFFLICSLFLAFWPPLDYRRNSVWTKNRQVPCLRPQQESTLTFFFFWGRKKRRLSSPSVCERIFLEKKTTRSCRSNLNPPVWHEVLNGWQFGSWFDGRPVKREREKTRGWWYSHPTVSEVLYFLGVIFMRSEKMRRTDSDASTWCPRVVVISRYLCVCASLCWRNELLLLLLPVR